MDNDLSSRLVRAEDGLLSAILTGESSLASWGSEWSAIVADLTEASSSGTSTVVAAAGDAVVSKVATIAKCLQEVARKDTDLSSKLLVDIDEILSSTHSLRPSPLARTSIPQRSKTDSPQPKNLSVDIDGVFPAFIGPAYRWLLRHIHNPYPSHDVKQNLAQASGYSLNAINSWFSSIRKRMGWTSICRERFHGCRADTVDAAFRALVQDDANHPVGDELTRAFVAMKIAAEKLYGSIFTKSTLVSGLDDGAEDVTHCSRQHGNSGISLELGCRKEYEGSQSNRDMHDGVVDVDEGGPYVYSRLLASAPLPSLTVDDNSGESQDDLPVPVAGKKRRAVSENQEDMSIRANRPRKRLRVREHPAISPQIPLYDTLEDSKVACHPSNGSSHPVAPSPPHCTGTTRKRWLSEVDVQGLPRDFCGPNIGLRIHAVSDPLPTLTSDTPDIDEWFNTHFGSLFEFPPPASTELDQTLPWEVELYHDYPIPLQGGNSPQMHDDSLALAMEMTDTLADFRVGDVIRESGLSSLVDSQLLDPTTFPSRSCSLDSSIPTLSPIIDWAHPFGSSADVIDTTLFHSQLDDSPTGQLTSSTSFSDDDIFASTSMLANEQFPFERNTRILGTSEVRTTA